MVKIINILLHSFCSDQIMQKCINLLTIIRLIQWRRIILLYRAVSIDELIDIQHCEKFRSSSNSMSGKWFAETAFDAAEWGRRFYQWSQVPFFIIQVDIPDYIAAQMFIIPNLDNIGAARWASEGELLDLINSTNSGIIELHTVPI